MTCTSFSLWRLCNIHVMNIFIEQQMAYLFGTSMQLITSLKKLNEAYFVCRLFSFDDIATIAVLNCHLFHSSHS